MSKHRHNIEYGQSGDDFLKKTVQMRCTTCGYKSYTFFRSMSEVFRIHPEFIEGNK